MENESKILTFDNQMHLQNTSNIPSWNSSCHLLSIMR